ncbi:C-C chemokine receptor type 5-like isoform X1 [Onychostoma macrolepis]|uniref:C-C chemokine receptor type 5-like isoform X1 n=1 Tax=Onychostoma macrolepis TaxID=369639 RepID=UPI00272BFDF8|nr:C-C chemokine receptor type 5-like isoform X1 [Onychostoma macrolepis]
MCDKPMPEMFTADTYPLSDTFLCLIFDSTYFLSKTIALSSSKMVTSGPLDLHYITSSTDDEPYEYSGNYDDLDFQLVCVYGNHGARILPILYSLYFVVGFLGNMLVVWVVCMGTKLRSMTDICLLNLALADLLLVSSFPFLAHHARDQWIFGDVMCTVVFSAYYIGFYSVIFFIVLMSIDQYMAIVHDVLARTYGILASVVIWIIAVYVAFPEMTHFKTKNAKNKIFCYAFYPTSDQNSYFSSRIFAIFKMNVIGLIIPLIVIGIFYSMILKRLLAARSSRKQDICHVITVMVVFFCCYAPYNVATFVKVLEQKELISNSCDFSKAIHLSLQITEALAFSHSCINPILFVFVREKYRRHLVCLLYKTPCGRLQCMNNNPTQATGSVYSHNTNDERTSTVV